ncbi:alkaline phosphatase [uncultured Chitinophaga sp.]|jgi:Alkaline phosphatase|uniref:alkaline phosphatase n=1 Tax=uncultured Chitinophaga sp. TaxID=339340 RepID=UPI00262D5402|nr:alkaline phosphatase [uncultured Chitinophaga sp.]
MRTYIWSALLVISFLPSVFAQSGHYTTANAHSHNDYEHDIPFLTAYYQHFGSIEADVFARNGQLYVAHKEEEIDTTRTLAALYLQPLREMIRKAGGKAYNNGQPLQLLIDFKTDSLLTMQTLLQQLQQYPDITGNTHIQLVISGSQPIPAQWDNYPAYILFDGKGSLTYSAAQLERLPLFSYNLQNYARWNGKGSMKAAEQQRVQALIDHAHQLGKKIRFWGTPDNVNTWITLAKMGVDYIGTDHIEALSDFLKRRRASEYQAAGNTHPVYRARYVNNDRLSKVKNVILLIGDGMGLTQIYGGYTANKGQLNLFQMINIGLSKTSSADNYITDSAAGGTAMATGHKTNNRSIGVDATGVKQPAIPDLIQRYGMESALISAGDVTDATPAAFYGHQPDRSLEEDIARDFLNSPVSILIGGGLQHFERRKDGLSLTTLLQQKGYTIGRDLSGLENMRTRKWVLLDSVAEAPVLKGRGDFLTRALKKTINTLQDNRNGFFIMAEGAQIDVGGHFNNLPYNATEMVDFDKAIGAAMEFADSNGETLVIVTADHETGGLSLLDGNIQKGYVNGHFSTDDHTAVTVPVFAYGPHSLDFRGVYENTAIFEKIMKILSERK